MSEIPHPGYMVISNLDIGEFTNACARALYDGWIPQGGVNAVYLPGQHPVFVYQQAFVDKVYGISNVVVVP